MLRHPSLVGKVWLSLSEGGWVSGERLAESLGVSKVAIWKAVEKLKSLGYTIRSEKGRGYRLLDEPKVAHPWRVAKRLRTRLLGSEILFVEETSSTQDVIKGMAREGIVAIAGRQEKGRGRLGRSWFSTEDDLKLSVLLKPRNFPPHRLGLISLLAGLAVCRALGGRLKWPNDVLLNGKKVAGILAEGEAQQDRVERVYLGIGINVNSKEELEKFGATSLFLHYSRRFDLADVAAKVLNELEPLYLEKGRLKEVKDVMDTLGKRVRVRFFDEEFEGIAKDVDEDGALIVEVNGETRRVLAGDVVHLRTS